MKYAAIAVVVVVGISVAAAASIGYRPWEAQVLPLPPESSLEQVIPELVAAVGVNDAARLPSIRALGHLGSNMQPSPYATTLELGDPVAQQRWEERMTSERGRRQKIYRLLDGASSNLVQLAGDSDAATRRQAMWALGAIRTTAPEVQPLLRATALDESLPSLDRQTAMIALSRVDPGEARSVIERILAAGTVDTGLLSAAASALRAMGADAVPQLRAMLQSGDAMQRGYAINAVAALRASAAPAAVDLAAAIVPGLPVGQQRAAVRALSAIAPDDVITLERVVATPQFNRSTCHTAGQLLGLRPGAIAFDYQRCAAHQAEPGPTKTPATVERALIAAAGGGSDLVVTQSAAGHQVGDTYGEAAERVIVACVEPRDTPAKLQQLGLDETAAPVVANELRIAAVRVAGDDQVLDSIGGLVDTETPAASCSSVEVDQIVDASRWPLAQLKFSTAQPSKAATTIVEWFGQIDPATQQWKLRFPSMLYHLRDDGTMFADQLRNEVTDKSEFKVIGRFSGIDAIVPAQPPGLALRYFSSMLPTSRSGFRSVIVAATPLTRARWTQVVMYPMDMSGRKKAKPVIPEGVPIMTLSGILIVPFAPDDPGPKAVFWRKYLKHDHLSVRLAAAQALAALKDRESIPGIVEILKTPTDLAAGAIAAIAPFGIDAFPYLEPLLKDQQIHVRQAAWSAVAKTATAAAPLIKQALDTGTDDQRQSALKALKDMRPSPAGSMVPQLVALIDRCDLPQWGMACYDIIDTLAAAGDSAAAAQPALEQRMQKTTGHHKLRVAAALRAVGGRDSAKAVIVDMARTGRDGDAEQALRQLTSDIKGDALPIFVEVLQRRDAYMASAFAAQQIGALSSAPDAAFPVMVTLAKDADPAVRRRVMPAFKAFRNSQATAQLGTLMRDPDGGIRGAAFQLLKDRGIEAVPLLFPAFDEPNNIRHALFAMLGKLGPQVLTVAPAMVTRLERIAKDDPDKSIQMNAARAAASIRGTK